MKDQITADLTVGAAKVAPAALGSAAAATQGWALADVAVALTILYTLTLFLTAVVKNWGLWMDWWAARRIDARRLWAWLRGW